MTKSYTIMRRLKITEVSAVDKPAQEHARAAIMKNADKQADIDFVAKKLREAQSPATAQATKHANPQTTTNYRDAVQPGPLSYLKGAAQAAWAARQAQFQNSDVIKSELRKLSSRDVGTAETKPRTVSGDAPLVDNPKSAYDQLKQLAVQVRRAASQLSEAQAFERVYQDPRNAELVARERAERFADARLVDLPDME
jgi:hypothetical protein